jgi:hypothetical protein
MPRETSPIASSRVAAAPFVAPGDAGTIDVMDHVLQPRRIETRAQFEDAANHLAVGEHVSSSCHWPDGRESLPRLRIREDMRLLRGGRRPCVRATLVELRLTYAKARAFQGSLQTLR